MSHALALVLTVAVMAAAIYRQGNESHEATISYPAIDVELAPDPAPPAPRAPDPPAPKPPKPRPVQTKAPKQHEAATAAPPMMAATAGLPAAVPAVNEPAAPAQDAAAEAPAAPIAASAGTLEAQYGATLRTNIDARTIAPDSVEYRLRRPHGETRVDFTLDRDGSVRSAGVARTSGSDILDRQAVGIVRAGHYPPFPAAAFRGESRHTFIVTLEFHP